MRIIAVDSSTIASMGYDEALELLQLEFRSGAIYHYFGVPASVYAELVGAESKGSYFNHVIRGAFRYCRVDADDRQDSGKAMPASATR